MRWFPITPWSHEYTKMLLARADALGIAGPAIEKVRSNSQPYQADDACEMELLLLRQMNVDQLRQEVRGLRARASAIASITLASSAGREPSDAEVLAEATYLVSAIQKAYVLNDEVEKTRWRMVFQMTLVAAGIIVAWLSAAWVRGQFGNVPNGVIVLGVMGGYTSCLRRVSGLAGVDQVAAIQAIQASRSSMIAAPILGAISSTFLLLCFNGGLVKGALFPNLMVTPDLPQGTPFLDFLLGTIQASNEDFAKLLVWSFVAGFSERLMPDMIDRLVAKSSKG